LAASDFSALLLLVGDFVVNRGRKMLGREAFTA
jgi:hypothetical protein